MCHDRSHLGGDLCDLGGSRAVCRMPNPNMMTGKYDMPMMKKIMEIDECMKEELCTLHGCEDEVRGPARAKRLETSVKLRRTVCRKRSKTWISSPSLEPAGEWRWGRRSTICSQYSKGRCRKRIRRSSERSPSRRSKSSGPSSPHVDLPSC